MLEPEVESTSTRSEYLIHLSAPRGLELFDTAAQLVDNSIELSGAIGSSARLCTYRARRSAAVYAEPASRALLGYLRAGAIVKGSAPSSRGWIALDDDETWMVDDGALALVEAPPEPEPFVRHVDLPADALVERATSERAKDQEMLIRVPRRPPAAPMPRMQPRPKPAPKAPPKRQHTGQERAGAAPVKTQSHEPPPPPPPPVRAARKPAAKTHAATPSLQEELSKLSSAEPLLIECASSASNVSSPREDVESWEACDGGGFVRAASE